MEAAADTDQTHSEVKIMESAEQHTQTDMGAKQSNSEKKSSTDNNKSSKGNHSDNKVNLVLLGMSGTGKSETGNTILGETKFVSKASSMPVTRECQSAETKIDVTCVRVIDTPDIFDDEIQSSVKNQHVKQCKQLCQSDPCVYLLVMHVSRFTDGERDILKKFEETFGCRAKERTIILFTRGEDLQSSDISLEEFLQDCQPELQNIVKQCGRRCVVFENRVSRQHQVTKLMQTVNMMLNKQQKQ
ncbi:GTPase IMAP family member 8-like [Scomber scombrus]|uniref:GTPase IMAP family member 8-like n=1 Tax=Scomber scombrus TaxID=13677 RepID=UPI002DDB5757|nr:GTPase IMAP family member 8-like [Scomber scombrus]